MPTAERIESLNKRETHIQSLLADISPERPCGEDKWLELESVITRHLATKPGGSDQPRWNDGLVASEDPFRAKCKDIRIAIHIAQALVGMRGVEGLSDGLRLLRQLIDRHGKEMYPSSPSARVRALAALCPGLRFDIPDLLRCTPLTEGGDRFSLRDLQLASGEQKPKPNEVRPASSEIEKAFKITGRERIAESCDDLAAALEHFDAISMFVETSATEDKPNLIPLRNRIVAIQNELEERLKRLGGRTAAIETPVQIAMNTTAEQRVEPISAAASAAIGAIHSRDDVVRVLNQVSEWYVQREPSSLIIPMVEQICRWVGKTYFEVLSDLKVENKDGAAVITVTLTGPSKSK